MRIKTQYALPAAEYRRCTRFPLVCRGLFLHNQPFFEQTEHLQ